MQTRTSCVALLLLCFVFLSGGCSIARTGELLVLGETNVLRSPQIETKLDEILPAQPESYPTIYYQVFTTLSAQDIGATLQAHFEKKGWKTRAPMEILDFPAHKELRASFTCADYELKVFIEFNDSPDRAPSAAQIEFVSRHPWDELPWVYPRFFFHATGLTWIGWLL